MGWCLLVGVDSREWKPSGESRDDAEGTHFIAKRKVFKSDNCECKRLSGKPGVCTNQECVLTRSVY